jgi:hypothetical protein
MAGRWSAPFASGPASGMVDAMKWLRASAAILSVAAAGCDRLIERPPAPGPASAQAALAADAVANIEAYRGRSYAEFAAAHAARFSAETLGLGTADRARLERAMVGDAGVVLEGGGAQALVFRGCAASGCADGVAVVAIDAATGAAFVGVRDGAGKDVLAPNDRLEALLRLNAGTRDWIDARPAQQAPATLPQPTAPP